MTTETKARLVSKGYGRYEVDEHTYISRDDTFETWCDNEPHPMKERVDLIRARFTDNRAFEDYMRGLGLDAKRIQRHTKGEGWVEYVTYQCPGDQIHYYSMWTVMVNGDWTENVYDTFTEARGALERIIGPTVLVRQKPKEAETTEDPVTGRRYWAACGHPAEYDIDMNCYVCHKKPTS